MIPSTFNIEHNQGKIEVKVKIEYISRFLAKEAKLPSKTGEEIVVARFNSVSIFLLNFKLFDKQSSGNSGHICGLKTSMDLSYVTNYSTVIGPMSAMISQFRKRAKNSIPYCERSKLYQFKIKNDIFQHYQSSNHLQDQLEPEKSKLKRENFGSYP